MANRNKRIYDAKVIAADFSNKTIDIDWVSFYPSDMHPMNEIEIRGRRLSKIMQRMIQTNNKVVNEERRNKWYWYNKLAGRN